MKKTAFSDFLIELRKELQFHLDGGTDYRQATAALAFVTAMETKTMDPFLNRETAIQTVTNLFLTLPDERIKDVGKMLNVIAKDLHRHTTLPEEIQKYVQLKQKNRENSFKKKKD